MHAWGTRGGPQCMHAWGTRGGPQSSAAGAAADVAVAAAAPAAATATSATAATAATTAATATATATATAAATADNRCAVVMQTAARVGLHACSEGRGGQVPHCVQRGVVWVWRKPGALRHGSVVRVVRGEEPQARRPGPPGLLPGGGPGWGAAHHPGHLQQEGRRQAGRQLERGEGRWVAGAGGWCRVGGCSVVCPPDPVWGVAVAWRAPT